jgi:hypothetical protein
MRSAIQFSSSKIDSGTMEELRSDLHVWRVGAQGHAAIVAVEGNISLDALRERLRPVHEIGHVTAAVR